MLQALLDGTFSIVGIFLPHLVDHFEHGRAQIASIGSFMASFLLLSGEIQMIPNVRYYSKYMYSTCESLQVRSLASW